MPLRQYVTRPMKVEAIQWNTDNDRRTIEEILKQNDYLFEYHEGSFFGMAPEHIHYRSMTDEGILPRGAVFAIWEDGAFAVTTPESLEKQAMTQADYDAMITDLAKGVTLD